MAIKPISGKLIRGMKFDIFGSLTLGIAVATGYWHFYHLPAQKRIEDFYANMKSKSRED